MCEACAPDHVLLARSALSDLRSDPGTASAAAPQPAPPPAATGDVVVHGGPIITMAGGTFSPVAALAIRDGEVLLTGTEAEVRAAVGADAEDVDLGGRCALPGFVEPHVHLIISAFTKHFVVDVSPTTVNRDRTEALLRLKAAVAVAKQAEADGGGAPWVQAFGYDPSRMNDYADLDGALLADVSAGVPIFVLNQSGHLAYVNPAAFAAAGITDDTPDPAGGTFCKVDGHLTGVILEQPAIVEVSSHAPTPPVADLVDACRQTLGSWADTGCTTVYDAGVGSILGTKDIDLVTAATAGDCPVRMQAALMPAVAHESGLALGGQMGSATAVGIKYWADGSTQGFTAALTEPYLGQTTVVDHLNWASSTALANDMRPWHEQGWQVLVHANGDAASVQAMDAFEAVLGSDPAPHPHRLEHFTVQATEQVERAVSLGLAVSHTIGHVRLWGATFLQHVLGSPRAERIDPLADDVAKGALFSLHSDSPVTPVGPLDYLHTAVTRTMDPPAGDVDVLGADQRIGLEDALRAVTLNPARQALLGDRVGSLEKGKSADLVILDRDPRTVDPAALAGLAVQETWLAGRRRPVTTHS